MLSSNLTVPCAESNPEPAPPTPSRTPAPPSPHCPGILYDVEGHPLKITLKAHLLCAELSGEDHTRRLAWIEQERQRIRVLFQELRHRQVTRHTERDDYLDAQADQAHAEVIADLEREAAGEEV